MKAISRFRFPALVVGVLTALTAPARGDVIDDLRRCGHAWVERVEFQVSPFGGDPRMRTDWCDLVGKPAGDLALVVNLRDFGVPGADVPIRLAGAVQPGGFVRWTVDSRSVPARAGGFDIRSLTGSVDTDVRAIGPFEADCGGVTRTYRVRLELRANPDLNRLVLDAGLVSGPETVSIRDFRAELATPARAALTLSSVTLASISVRGAADRPTRVSGTVWLTAEPDGRTYDVTLTTRGTPANAGIRVEPASMHFAGTTRSQGFTLTAPVGYYGAVEVTGTGGDGTVRRATVRITDPNAVFVPRVVVPERWPQIPHDYRPDPAPDVLRSLDPARRTAPPVPARKPAMTPVLPAGRASIPTPQEPFAPKAGSALVPPVAGKRPAGGLPIPPAVGRGPKD